MSNLLEGKLALILGIANKWSLAYAIAQAFWREGATLALTYLGDRQKVAIEELSQGLPVAGLWPCDVTKEEVLLALTESLRALGRPLDASSYSLVAVARATTPIMTAGGALMTLTYLGSTRVVPNYNVMGVAKASLEASVRYLASDLGPQRIRVNAISAGPVKTASARAVKDFTSILDYVAQRSPLRRNPDPAEVADTAVFLASDLGRGVTANTIFVDAGIQIMGL